MMARILIQQTLLLLMTLLPQEGIDAEPTAFFGATQVDDLVAALLDALVRAVDH